MTAALSILSRANRDDVIACISGSVLIAAAYVVGAVMW